MAHSNEKINSYSGVVSMGTEKFGGPGFFMQARPVELTDAVGQACGLLGFKLSTKEDRLLSPSNS